MTQSAKSVEDVFEEIENKRIKLKKNNPIGYFLIHCVYYPIYRFWHNRVRMYPKEVKWFIQRGKRGFSDCDVWNFYDYHSKMVKEALIKLRKDKHGYPANLSLETDKEDEGAERWNTILGKIINTFEQAEKIGSMDVIEYIPGDKTNWEVFIKKHPEVHLQTKEEADAMKEGFELFIKYYFSLWD